jgi:hypothetical protein
MVGVDNVPKHLVSSNYIKMFMLNPTEKTTTLPKVHRIHCPGHKKRRSHCVCKLTLKVGLPKLKEE